MEDTLYDFMYMGDYNKNIAILSEMTLPEKWNFQGNDQENWILKNI